MVEGIKEKIERFILKAELFLKNDTRIFIIDVKDNYYWADLLFVGEDTVRFQCFSGKLTGEKITLLWVDVVKFEEYKDRKT